MFIAHHDILFALVSYCFYRKRLVFSYQDVRISCEEILIVTEENLDNNAKYQI